MVKLLIWQREHLHTLTHKNPCCLLLSLNLPAAQAASTEQEQAVVIALAQERGKNAILKQRGCLQHLLAKLGEATAL